MAQIILFDFWRSSASYRVRIALNLKSIAYETVSVSLPDGANRDDAYIGRNPQGLVPMLHIDGHDLTQSLAIIDYLDAHTPTPRLVPVDPLQKAKVMAAALVIAADIHPLNNLRVLNYLKGPRHLDPSAVDDWYRHWVVQGFAALEAMAPEVGLFGGDAPNIADICLVPQMYNARRFETPLANFPKLVRIDAVLQTLPAFANAAPEAVKP